MLKHLLACFLPLVLGACLASDRPMIVASDLATPADLAGRYWRVGVDVRPEIDAAEFVFADNTYKTGSAEGELLASLRLVQVARPDLYVLVDDSDKEQSLYFLLRRERGGAWRLSDIGVDGESLFEAANFAFVDQVARRHGFSLKDGKESGTIEGPVDSGRIPALLRDPEFLGALRIKDMAIYLPAGGARARPGEIPLRSEQEARRPLHLASALPSGLALADPQGFAGRYYSDHSIFDLSSCAFDLRRLEDGRFAHSDYDKLALLRFDGTDERFLGVNERNYGDAANPSIVRTLYMVERGQFGWFLTQLMIGEQASSEELNALRSANMRTAARRHGFDFAGHTLSGAIELGRLQALLADGQFTSGLRTDLAPPFEFISAVKREKVCTPGEAPAASVTRP